MFIFSRRCINVGTPESYIMMNLIDRVLEFVQMKLNVMELSESAIDLFKFSEACNMVTIQVSDESEEKKCVIMMPLQLGCQRPCGKVSVTCKYYWT